jgi:hypothetical protein
MATDQTPPSGDVHGKQRMDDRRRYRCWQSDRKCRKRFLVSLSNHEAPHHCPREAFTVGQLTIKAARAGRFRSGS